MQLLYHSAAGSTASRRLVARTLAALTSTLAALTSDPHFGYAYLVRGVAAASSLTIHRLVLFLSSLAAQFLFCCLSVRPHQTRQQRDGELAARSAFPAVATQQPQRHLTFPIRAVNDNIILTLINHFFPNDVITWREWCCWYC